MWVHYHIYKAQMRAWHTGIRWELKTAMWRWCVHWSSTSSSTQVRNADAACDGIVFRCCLTAMACCHARCRLHTGWFLFLFQILYVWNYVLVYGVRMCSCSTYYSGTASSRRYNYACSSASVVVTMSRFWPCITYGGYGHRLTAHSSLQDQKSEEKITRR